MSSRYFDVTFAWNNAAANWNAMSAASRQSALLGDGLVRNEYNRGTVRIIETYYEPRVIRIRRQEELRNGRWVSHGPDVYWRQDGSYEVGFRIDGELEGPRIYFDAAGNETRRDNYSADVFVEQ